jgi:hypothetical protein
MPTSSTYAPGFVFFVARPLRRGLGCRSPRPRASSSKPTPASSASDRWAAMPGEVQHQHQHQHQTWHGDMVKAQERIHALHRVLGAFESYNVLLVWPQSLVPGIHPVGFAVPSCLLGHSSAFGAHLGIQLCSTPLVACISKSVWFYSQEDGLSYFLWKAGSTLVYVQSDGETNV